MLITFCINKTNGRVLGYRTPEELAETPFTSQESSGIFEILTAELEPSQSITLWSSAFGAIPFRLPSPSDPLPEEEEE